MPSMRLLFLAAAVSLAAFSLPSHAQSEIEPGIRPTSSVSVAQPSSEGPRLTSMHASAIVSDAHTGSNAARGIVWSGQHNTIELPGTSAALSLTTAQPVFYLHIDTEDPNDQRSQITLLRLKPGKENRLVLNMTANTFGGSRKRKDEEIAVTKTDVSAGWVKLTPTAPLPPGEYGIMFLPKNTNMFTDRVYDFSVPAK